MLGIIQQICSIENSWAITFPWYNVYEYSGISLWGGRPSHRTNNASKVVFIATWWMHIYCLTWLFFCIWAIIWTWWHYEGRIFSALLKINNNLWNVYYYESLHYQQMWFRVQVMCRNMFYGTEHKEHMEHICSMEQKWQGNIMELLTRWRSLYQKANRNLLPSPELKSLVTE